MLKVSEFCNNLDPRSTYNADTIAAAFRAQTGKEPCWPTHSPKETAEAIDKHSRERGGNIGAAIGPMYKPQVYGYEVVASCAEHFANQRAHNQLSGIGFIYQLAMHEIVHWEKAGEPAPKLCPTCQERIYTEHAVEGGTGYECMNGHRWIEDTKQ